MEAMDSNLLPPWPCPLPRALRALAVTAVAALSLTQALPAHADTPQTLLARFAAQAGRAPDAAQGQRFYLARHGAEWSCASCHNANPSTPGRHAATGKALAPLSPLAQPGRFTDAAKVDKWYRRNCKEVVGRECTAAEKADVLAWLLTPRP